MRQPLITFIIPAYNAAPYIRACVESVFGIELHGHEREVIAIDDGSTDNTSEVLAQCKSDHPELLLISQGNQGPSVARNAGMEKACGKYIFFVDADDRLDCCCDTKELVSALEDGVIDIIGINSRQTNLAGRTAPYRRYVPQYNKVYAPARTFMRGRNLFPCVWAYLFRREFLTGRQLRFMPFALHEDDDFTVRTFALARNFMAIDADLYVRIQRKGSITTTNDREMQKRKLRDVMKILAGLEDFSAPDAELQRCMRRKTDYLVVDALRLLIRQRHDIAFRKEIVRSLKGMRRFPLRWRWEPKYIMFNLFTRLYLCFFQ